MPLYLIGDASNEKLSKNSINCRVVINNYFFISLIFKESKIYKEIENQYEINEIINVNNKGLENSNTLDEPVTILGNTISISLLKTGRFTSETVMGTKKEIYDVSVTINNKKYTNTEAWIRPNRQGDVRYLSWLQILNVLDKKNENRVVVAQRISGDWIKGQKKKEFEEDQTWRMIYIYPDQSVKEETFKYNERENHLLGVRIIQIASISTSFIGFESKALTYFPSNIYPDDVKLFVYQDLEPFQVTKK
ncbi:hypothetical protein [Cohnella sp.]|uniref:hypothetical protein n=1 Tax=Cohnella sp. TaxID=1883426 RepID=UPI003566193B